LKSENLPSFCLLIGYSGSSALQSPYILFKLEEIKEWAVSPEQHASLKLFRSLSAHTLFTFKSNLLVP